MLRICTPLDVRSVLPAGPTGTFCSEGNAQMTTETPTDQRKKTHFAALGSSGHCSLHSVFPAEWTGRAGSLPPRHLKLPLEQLSFRWKPGKFGLWEALARIHINPPLSVGLKHFKEPSSGESTLKESKQEL